MIHCPTVRQSTIRSHYNLGTFFYWLLWGSHIHHGYWEADERPSVAQIQLTERLAAEAQIADGSDVLDVGCGMGGSSIHLARHKDCRVTGVTLSSVQRRWARLSARMQGEAGNTHFLVADAEKVELEPASFDVVWSVECTEHLFDKAAFFRRVAGWLRPGGRVAICAWLAGDAPLTPEQRQAVLDVCEGFFCPSLGSRRDYCDWMSDAGLEIEQVHDWTDRVERTWQICQQRVRRTGMPLLARILGRDSVLFLDRFETILNAYRTRAMRYGCFVARKT